MKQDLTMVGRLGKAHGLAGEIKLSVDEAYAELVLEQHVLFVAIGGQQLPYFVENLRGGGSWLVKFEDIDDKETASALRGGKVSIPTKLLEGAAAAVALVPYLSWVGYRIYDREYGDLGLIEEVLDLTQHYLAQLRYEGRDIYLPLHDDLIAAVDDERRRIEMELPEGILEL